jgi:hypothetical protein
MKLTLGLLVAAAISFSGCSKDDDQNGNSNGNGNDNYDGYITFYTKDTGNGCGDITLSLNGTSIGPLSGTTATDPACGADNGSGIVTVGVSIGAHDYAASDGCDNIWTGTIIINKGDCKTKELTR